MHFLDAFPSYLFDITPLMQREKEKKESSSERLPARGEED